MLSRPPPAEYHNSAVPGDESTLESKFREFSNIYPLYHGNIELFTEAIVFFFTHIDNAGLNTLSSEKCILLYPLYKNRILGGMSGPEAPLEEFQDFQSYYINPCDDCSRSCKKCIMNWEWIRNVMNSEMGQMHQLI